MGTLLGFTSVILSPFFPARPGQVQRQQTADAAGTDHQRHGQRAAVMQGTDQQAKGGAQAKLAGNGEAGGGASLPGKMRQQAGHAVGTEQASDTDVEQQAQDNGRQAAKAAGTEQDQVAAEERCY